MNTILGYHGMRVEEAGRAAEIHRVTIVALATSSGIMI